MSTVIWINYLRDGVVSSAQEDLPSLHAFAPHLDRVCAELGVAPLTAFHDTTDAEANLADVDPESNDPNDPEAMDGWARLARHGAWHDPSVVLASLTAVRDHLRVKPRRFGLLANKYAQVMADLDLAIAAVEKGKADGASVHLGVVL